MITPIDVQQASLAATASDLSELAQRQSLRLDEGLMETFPASDPVSVAQID